MLYEIEWWVVKSQQEFKFNVANIRMLCRWVVTQDMKGLTMNTRGREKIVVALNTYCEQDNKIST